MVTYTILATIALAIAVLRFALPVQGLNKADIFKDVAHLFVGGLFGAGMATGIYYYYLLAAALTLVEAVAFVVRLRPPSQ